MAINWNGIELLCKTADLIASDRAGTVRDDGYHHGLRSEFERCAKSVLEAVKSINRALDAMTKGGA